MNIERPRRRNWTPVVLCVSAALFVLEPGSLLGQVSAPPLSSSFETSRIAQIQELVDAALLADSDEARDASLEAAEVFARSLVDQEPESAEATYWLAVVLGIRTENTGGLGKLSLGREVFALSARVVALDSLYAGGQELMGRVHSNIQRLSWIARQFALSGDMGDVVGDSSWEVAMAYFERACELDPTALGPRFELAKIYLERDRKAEGQELLGWLLEQEYSSPVELRMLEEVEALVADSSGP